MDFNSLFTVSNVYAQTTAGTAPAAGVAATGEAAPKGGLSGFGSFLPLIAIFVVFYFILIRPQSKKAKETQKMNEALKKGDKIITSGGIYGVITGLDDRTATIETAPKVRQKMLRSHISGKVNDTVEVDDGPAIKK